MKRNPHKRERDARALTDPRPEFVSLVQTGANMTPFRAVKMEALPDQGVDPMTTVHKQADHEIARLVFDALIFDTEKDVAEWMTAGGYEGFTVTKSETGDFEVNDETTEFEGDLKAIEADNGVTALVGKIKSTEPAPTKAEVVAEKTQDSGAVITAADAKKADAEDGIAPVIEDGGGSGGAPATEAGDPGTSGEPATEAAKDEAEAEKAIIEAAASEEGEAATEADAPSELKAKFDEFSAMFSDGTTLAEVAADATSDGFPPAIFEVTNLFFVAMRNNIVNGDINAIRGVAAEFGEMIVSLAELFVPQFEGVEREAAQKMIDILAPALTASGESVLTAPAKDEDDKDVAEMGLAEIPVAPEAGPALASVVAKQEESATALHAITEAVTEMVAAVKEVRDEITGLKTEVSDTKETIEGRVKTLEDARQTRKGADVDETDNGSTHQPKAKPALKDDPLARGLLGVSAGTAERFGGDRQS